MSPKDRDKEIQLLRADAKQACSGDKKARFSADYKARVMALEAAGFSVNDLSRRLDIACSVIYSWREAHKAPQKPRVLTVADATTTPRASVETAAQNIEIRVGSLILTISQAGV